MSFTGVGEVFSFGRTLINKIFPNPEDKAKAEALLVEAEDKGELNELNAQMQVMVAEAKSADPWTSRARPSFLYVIYLMILWALPMSIIYAINPTVAGNMIIGVKLWLASIPKELWTVFGLGYLGYTGAREYGKKKVIDAIGNLGGSNAFNKNRS